MSCSNSDFKAYFRDAESLSFDHVPPMSEQERISPYNFNTISSIEVMRIKKISIRGLLIDPIPNSPNWHHKSFMEDS